MINDDALQGEILTHPKNETEYESSDRDSYLHTEDSDNDTYTDECSNSNGGSYNTYSGIESWQSISEYESIRFMSENEKIISALERRDAQLEKQLSNANRVIENSSCE